MRRFYDVDGKPLGYAWGVSACDDVKNHIPHVHDSSDGWHDPYLCPGIPPVKVYDTKPRMPLN